MYVKLFVKAAALATRHRFIAIFAGRALPEGLVAWVIARMLGRPVLVYAHGEELTGWGRGRKFALMRFVLRHGDAVLANSDFTRDTLAGLLGVDPGRISVVYPTVDADRFRPGISGDDQRARIGARARAASDPLGWTPSAPEGLRQRDPALPLLRQQGIDAHYAVIGIGEDREYLQRLAAELGVADRVHLLGHVSYEDLPRWYAACDLFAMPNRDIDGDTEGFGMVFLEAAVGGQARGGRHRGRDRLRGRRRRYRVARGRRKARVNHGCIGATACWTRRRLERMGLNGRRRVLENFTHRRRVDQLRALALRGRYPGKGSDESAHDPVADGVKGMEFEAFGHTSRMRRAPTLC